MCFCVCVCVCLKACPSSSKERGVFSAVIVKKRVNNPSSLSFSSSIIKRFRFRLDFLLFGERIKTRAEIFFL